MRMGVSRMGMSLGMGFAASRGGASPPDVTAPTITSAAAANNVEGVVLAHALTADESVTWAIRTAVQDAASVDAARFELSGSTLRWLSNGVKDYEAPDDTGANNTYVVVVRATDAALNTTDQTITITVTDADEVPSAFSFTDVTGATISTQYTSNTITVAGLGTGVSTPVTITGGTYSKNGGAYTSSAGTAVNGDTFAVRQTSSGSGATQTDVVLTIGGVSDTYSVTTASTGTSGTFLTGAQFIIENSRVYAGAVAVQEAA